MELKAPFALDSSQQLLSPEVAEKGQEYFCPACGDPVILKKGDVKVVHFAHKLSDACSQETIIHKTAKLLVLSAVTEWKSGKRVPPLVKRQCRACNATINQPLPDKVQSATMEYRLSDGFVADVALMANEQALAAVEIRVTHAVDEVKAATLSVPFIELDGNEVLADPNVWKPVVDSFKPFPCQNCEDIVNKFSSKISEIAGLKNIRLPSSYYRYSFCRCWKCKKDTLVFTWPGKESNVIPLRQPRPANIQYRFSKTVGSKYWANVCVHRGALQGDFFLYNEPDGPFFGFHCGRDTSDDFDKDQRDLAHYMRFIDES